MSNITIDPNILSTATNKTVLITGAARGIGAATAKQFNAHGANVVLADLAQFRSTAEGLIEHDLPDPSRAIFVQGDIVDWIELRECFKKTLERFGGIDIVVANAGIMESRSVLDFEVDEDGELKEDDEAKRVFDVNLRGTLNSEYRYAMDALSV
jgi:NAD(P)-dependent dehydrogenase (short-subunit alcohol dehydrogenase family)